MGKAEELKSYLPSYYYDSREMNAKCDTTGAELDDLIFNTDDVVKQCFPQTATWGVEYWEKFLGIPSNIDEDISSRRAKIITKMSRASPMTPFEIRRILKNFVDEVLINQIYEIYKFEITLITRTKIDRALDTILKEIEDSKPAHMSYSIAIDYLTEYTVEKVFNKWATDPYKICGTFDTAGNEVITTQGKTIATSIENSINAFISDEFMRASSETVTSISGKTISSDVEDSIKGYTSDILIRASSTTYSRGGVLVYDI